MKVVTQKKNIDQRLLRRTLVLSELCSAELPWVQGSDTTNDHSNSVAG